MIKDPHDPRDFRLWVTLNDNGTIAATHLFDATTDNPGQKLVEVTDLGLADYSKVTIDASLVTKLGDSHGALMTAQLALAEARGGVLTATAKVTDAIASALKPAPVVIVEVPPVK